MPFKKKTVQKLTSFSVLGVGALVVGADQAEATVTYVPVGVTVGFDSGDVSHIKLTITTGGANHQFLSFSTQQDNTPPFESRQVKFPNNNRLFLGTNTAGTGGFLKVFNQGVNFLTATGDLVRHGRVAQRNWNSTLATGGAGLNGFTDKFALFEFTPVLNPAGPEMYGWIELSLAVDKTQFGPTPASAGPNLTIVGFAYDDSGAVLPAGVIPEPATFELAGLGALALGAVGVRRWRAARNKA